MVMVINYQCKFSSSGGVDVMYYLILPRLASRVVGHLEGSEAQYHLG